MTTYDNTKSGVRESTPQNIMLGAGTVHKNLKYTEGSGWNFLDTCFGATSGGNKLSITPELLDVDVDGANVKVSELSFKVGEVATLEVNLTEVTSEHLATASIGKVTTSSIEGFNLIESKAVIEKGDYFENVAFVGVKQDGTPVIAILENALCTSGLELDNQKKNNTKIKMVFECYQKIGGDLRILPWKIYYPTINGGTNGEA